MNTNEQRSHLCDSHRSHLLLIDGSVAALKRSDGKVILVPRKQRGVRSIFFVDQETLLRFIGSRAIKTTFKARNASRPRALRKLAGLPLSTMSVFRPNSKRSVERDRRFSKGSSEERKAALRSAEAT